MEEVWKDIKGYEGLYQVSNLGRVKSLDHWTYRRFNFGVCKNMFYKGMILKHITDTDGYAIVSLSGQEKQMLKKVHRLVANAFIPKIEGKDIVNHKDGNKKNNVVSNLEWCTPKENTIHCYRVLGYVVPEERRAKLGMKNRKKVQCVETGEIFESYKMASLWLGCNENRISHHLRGASKTAGGYHWRAV